MTDEQAEKIKKYYGMLCHYELSKPYEQYDPSAIQAIQNVLDILELKIIGVNA